LICRFAIDFRISLIAFLIAIVRCVIVGDGAFILFIFEYEPNIKSVNIKLLESAKSFKALNDICKAKSGSISGISAIIIEYIFRTKS